MEMNQIYENKEEDMEEEKESRVGKKLAEIITIRVIILVLCLILILPLFSATYFFQLESDMDQHLSTLSDVAKTSSIADIQSLFDDI